MPVKLQNRLCPSAQIDVVNSNISLAQKYKDWELAKGSIVYFLHDDRSLYLRESLNGLFTACCQSNALKYLSNAPDKSVEFSVMVFCSHIYNSPQVHNTARYLMSKGFYPYINCQLAIVTEVPVAQLAIMVNTTSNPLEVFLKHTDFSILFKAIQDPNLSKMCDRYLMKRTSKWYY